MYAAALLALAAVASAQGIMGFNYGSTGDDGAPRTQQDFEAQFSAARKIANGAFTSARLYTMIQGGSAADPIGAIPAAISTKTHLLLGLWASAGDEVMNNEITALKTAIQQFGSDFTDLVDGISVGNEDLYRTTDTSQKHDPGLPGVGPDVVANYINQVRQALQGTPLSGAQIGHVDTWTQWVNGSNAAVVDACDFIGMDAYPYFQDLMANDIGNSKALFDNAWSQTKQFSKGKPVWITETGWPVSGKTAGGAVPSPENAQQYWEAVGCGQLFGQTNTWWFTYYDGAPDPSFGLVSSVGGAPRYDLDCNKKATIGAGVASTLGGGVVGPATGGGSYATPTPGSNGYGYGSPTVYPTPPASDGAVPVPTGGATGSDTSSTTDSGDSGTGAASTNGACFLGLIAAALVAVFMG